MTRVLRSARLRVGLAIALLGGGALLAASAGGPGVGEVTSWVESGWPGAPVVFVVGLENANLVAALLHDVNVILRSDQPDNLGREAELDGIKRKLRLTEKIHAGNASDAEKGSVADLVHPQVRATFGL